MVKIHNLLICLQLQSPGWLQHLTVWIQRLIIWNSIAFQKKKSQARVLYCPARTEKRQNRYTSCWIHFFKNHKGMSNSLHDWLKNFQQPFWVFHQNKTNALIHSFLLCDKSCNRFKIQYNSGSQFFFQNGYLYSVETIKFKSNVPLWATDCGYMATIHNYLYYLVFMSTPCTQQNYNPKITWNEVNICY